MSRLPPELEREIFENAALNDTRTTLSLILVARRTHIWCLPALYRTIQVNPGQHKYETFKRALVDTPWVAAGLRHIHFESVQDCNFAVCASIVAACPNITSIGATNVFAGPSSLEAMSGLPNLRRLVVALYELFDDTDASIDSTEPIAIDPRHPVFARVTHLSLHDNMGSQQTPAICEALPGFPALTHLRLKLGMSPVSVRILLGACPRLEVLLLTDQQHTVAAAETYPLEDPRLVWGDAGDNYSTFWASWLYGAMGNDDLWTVADEVVRKRKENPRPMYEVRWLQCPSLQSTSDGEQEEEEEHRDEDLGISGLFINDSDDDE
ncbi:hypothetical protein MKEN_00267900 [Mycena kentingensis (nom. inval.)]|nr:hypothetical protein MKEN_00267900 [Mycena kentingensis (nom. inval.)]